METKYSVTVGEKTYMVDVSESEGKWTAGVVPASGPPGYRSIWTCEAESEEGLKQQVDAHFEVLKAKTAQG